MTWSPDRDALRGRVAVVAGATRGAGRGIAAAVDHLDPAKVQALAEQIRRSHRHIDVLVNNIWGAELLKGGPAEWNTPIWKHDLANLIDKPGGLLVEVTTAQPSTMPRGIGSPCSMTWPRWR